MNARFRLGMVWAVFFSMGLITDSMAAAATAVKQVEAGEYPGGIAWNKPEGNVLWKIEIRRPNSRAHSGLTRQIRAILVHQHLTRSMVVVRYPEHSVEYWSDGNHAAVSLAGSSDVVEYVAPRKNEPRSEIGPPAETAHGMDLGGLARMSEWDWVKPEFYRGRLMVNGVSMLVFYQSEPGQASSPAGDSIPGPKEGSGPALEFPIEGVLRAAVVEEKSRLPRVLQLGDEFWDYSFHSGQQPQFAFPEKVRRFFALMAPHLVKKSPLP